MDPAIQPKSLLGALGMFCVLSAGLTVTYFVVLSVYRLYFSPLSKFPGPKLNAISPIPSIISLLSGRGPFDTKLMHDKYGPVIRVSPNELHFNTAQSWQDIYGHRNGHVNFHKDPIHVGSVEPVIGVSTLTMSDDENHARQRRALAHSFSQKALSEQEHIIQGYVSTFIAQLGKMSARDEEFNMVDWLNFTTFDIIGDLAFGEPFGCLKDGEFHFWVSLIFETVKAGAIEQATRRMATAGTTAQNFLLSMIPDRIRKMRRQHLEFSREKVMRRLATKTEHRDFIWYILKQAEKYSLAQDEIIVNSALFIVAGSETTANALSGILARLVYNKEKYRKLVHEIRSTFANEKDMNFSTLSDLTYLNAVLEEGLRIHPPVPTGLPPSPSAPRACHNEANFRDCDTFIPERWIGNEYDGDLKKAAQPFSLGPRGCIGRNLSYMEMRIILARLLWNFDLVSVDGAPNWNPAGVIGRARAFMTWEKPDLNVKAVPVKR
ncbi:hypothetical protein VE04_00739 [Pseudogymnoascus sp. 24MN13]|nr:hypothetical protein VE04_00739 [Pseudogymnoascus sp. 24MN13]